MPPIISTINNYIFKKTAIILIVFILIVILGSFLFEYYLVNNINDNWEDVSNEKNAEIISFVQTQFEQYRNENRLLLDRITSDEKFIDAVKNQNKPFLFKYLKEYSVKNSGVEIYDSSERLMGWVGESGSNIKIDSFYTQEISYVEQGLIFSWLILSKPITDTNGLIIGFAVLKNLFDVQYSLNHRFVSSEMFEGVFAKKINYPLQFNFKDQGTPIEDTLLLIISLSDLNQNSIGYAYMQKPLKSVYIDDIKQNISYIRHFLIIVILILLALRSIKILRNKNNLFLRSFSVIIVLWILRYALLYFNFPSGFTAIELFNPKLFASAFGFGIVKSIGEMFITGVFLLISVMYIFSDYLEFSGRIKAKKNIPLLFNFTLILIMAITFVLLFRGYIAIIISAINDSTLDYLDTSELIPSFEHIVMYFNLFFVSFAFIMIAKIIFFLSVAKLDFIKSEKWRWFLTYALFISVSSIHGIIHSNPLTSQLTRFVLITVLFSLSFSMKNRIFRLKNYSIVLNGILAIILLAVSMFTKMVDERKAQLQIFGNEISRPIDSWLTFIMDESLNQFTDKETAELLLQKENFNEIAFQRWTTTLLSREGFNCEISVINDKNEIISSFNIGSKITTNNDKLVLSKYKMISLVEDYTVHGAIKYYRGYTPIFSPDSILLGGVYIKIGASKAELFKTEQSDILRKYTARDLSTYYAGIYYSEYFNGKRVYSTNPEFTGRYNLTDNIYEQFSRSEKKFLSVSENIDGKDYETVILKSPDTKNVLIVINAEKKGLFWDSLIFVRMIIFLLVIGFILFIIIQLVSVQIDRSIFILDYRKKIIIAFLFLSILPLILVGYYNRYFATQSTADSLRKTLEEETSKIQYELIEFKISDDPLQIFNISDTDCKNISKVIGADFSLYADAELNTSSIRELYDAGFINSRLSSNAYENIVLSGRKFFVENISLGRFDYLVGYRGIYDELDNLVGIISVPTLYRQSLITRELSERNAYLFGVYGLIVIISIIISAIFANQISKPVRKLYEATKKIAEGDFDYQITSSRKDEFGKLETAFNSMTDEIKKKREELIKFEKELAWKEMARQVAHEIKNPLTPINLAVQHLQKTYFDKSKDFEEILNQSATMIKEQIEALNRIASEFSFFGRLPSRNLSVHNVNEVVMDAAKLFSRFENLNLKYELHQTDLFVLADEEELRRAFINIIRNAVQAVNEKGDIGIYTEKKGDNVIIKISDTGTGISAENGQKIFEPNFSTKTDGMGLGLAIVKKTVDDMKGSISYVTKINTGTTFIITLPLFIGSKNS